MTTDLRIFLSSTSKDLFTLREQILYFLQVLRSDLIAMETFGSDESTPKEVALRNVANCNLFVGVYAERYGTIDPETGLSLTELEYHEAYHLLERGKLRGLLLYCVDPGADWPIEHVDRNPDHVEKLASLKRLIGERHTFTRFKQRHELPFLILRDVINKIGLGAPQVFRPQSHRERQFRQLSKPVGMEFYDEELMPFFAGRQDATTALQKHVTVSPFALLIGPSGIGKTSLIRAGLFPRLNAIGWRTAIARPLSDLRSAFWAQLMEGNPPSHFDLINVIRSIASAHEPSQVLLVIDQFEDLISSNTPWTIEQVASELGVLHTAMPDNLRVLISYRADAEADLGVAWQIVSGAPAGLPRSYLDGLSSDGTREALVTNLAALPYQSETTDRLVEHIASDVVSFSRLIGYSGSYPPFVQIAITWLTSLPAHERAARYAHSGGVRQIVADYLLGQLRFLGRQEQAGRRLVVALASSHGTKTQRSVVELAQESHLDTAIVGSALKQLVDLRLVRQVGERFELAHDFVAQSVITQLASSEEIEAKMYRELLASRAAAYGQTHALLTTSEHLQIYMHRADLMCTEPEIELLLRGYFACTGPIFYWAGRYGAAHMATWIRTLLEQLDDDARARAYLLLINLGAPPSLEELVHAWSSWEYRGDLAAHLPTVATGKDIELLASLHRKGSPEVSLAAGKTLVRLIDVRDTEVLRQLSRSRHWRTSVLFEEIAGKAVAGGLLDREASLRHLESRERWSQLMGINALSRIGTIDDIPTLQSIAVDARRATTYRGAAAWALARLGSSLSLATPLIELLSGASDPSGELMGSALDGLTSPLPGLGAKDLIALADHQKWPNRDLPIATAIRLATRQDLPILEELFKQDAPTGWSYRDPIATALVQRYSELSGPEGFGFLFAWVLDSDRRIDLREYGPVIHAIASLARRRHLAKLCSIMSTDDFWTVAISSRGLLVQSTENLHLLRRIVGVAFSKIAGRKEWPVLLKLLAHNYWTIRAAAAEAIARLAQVEDIDAVVEHTLTLAEENRSEAVRLICHLDRKFFGGTETSLQRRVQSVLE